MNRMFLISVAAAAALPASFASAADLAEVQALADRWTAAYNSHDREALGALYAEDAHLYLHGSPMFVGREDIEAFWASDMQIENPLTVLSVTHHVAGVDMILVHGDYQVIDRDSGVPLGQGRFAHIWELGAGDQWLLDRDLWNQPFEEAQ